MRNNMTHRVTLHTVDDLVRYLSSSEMKGRPLCQVMTVTVNIGGAGADMKKVYFNQLDNFAWDADNDELEVEI